MADDKHAKRMFYDWCLLPFIWTYTQDLKLCKTQIKVYEPSNDKKHVGLPHELLELKPRRFSEQPTAMRENNCVEPNKVFWCFLEKKGYAPRIFLRWKFITTKYLPTIVHRWCAKRLNTQDIPHLTGDVTQSHHMTCFILLMRNLFPSKPYMVLKHWRAYEDTTLAASPLDVRCLSLPWPLSLLPIQVASAVAKAAMRFRRASFKYKEHW
jgi:hypothetical protein